MANFVSLFVSEWTPKIEHARVAEKATKMVLGDTSEAEGKVNLN